MNDRDGSAPQHMSREEFRAAGHALIDWIADYRERLAAGDIPIRSTVKPGEFAARVPAHPPEVGEPFERWLADLDEIVVPALTHWQHPGFFGFFPGSSGEPAILGELASAGLAVQGMMWETSPACTELETVVLDWLAELLGLPDGLRSSGTGGGVIHDTASTANLTAIVAGRHACAAERPADAVVYASTEAHSSIAKGAAIAGARTHIVETDAIGAMDPAGLAAAIDEDRAAGLVPAVVCSTVGSTNIGAIDPLRSIGEIAGAAGVWHHVDAAMFGIGALCEEHRWMHDGIETADSYVTNPHKWMLVNLDCSAFWVRDRARLIDAMGITPPYLETNASSTDEVIDYRHWHPQLGRRFRALKLWFTIRHYGAAGLRAHVHRHVEWAQRLSGRVEHHERLELAAPTHLSLVCFSHTGGDVATRRVCDAINADDMLAAPSHHDGRVVVRIALGGRATEERHVERCWDRIVGAA